MRSVPMHSTMVSRKQGILLAAGLVATLSATVSASVPTQVIATRFDLATGTASQVPGLPQSQIDDAAAAGAVISWSNPAFGSPGLSNASVIDNAGNVAFYGQINQPISGPPPLLQPIITRENQNAVFYSSAASNYAYNDIQIVARDGTSNPAPGGVLGGPTPSNPNNWVLNSTSNQNGINAGVGMSSSGTMLVTGQLNGAGATSSNNTAFFTGGPSSLEQAAIRSQPAPGTSGAMFNTNLNFSAINNSVNPSGQVPFSSALTGGDTVTSGAGQNDSGMWVGSPSGISLVMRRGGSVPDGSGAVFGAMTTNPGNSRINASGNVVFSNNLSTTDGTTPATVANDAGLYTNVGGSLQTVAREGFAVGGSSSLASETYLSNTGTFGLPQANVSSQALNNNGTILYGAKFNDSGSINSTNNEALMVWSSGSAAPIFQTGTTAVPGVSGATFANLGFGNTQARINNNESIVFTGAMNVDGVNVTAANDQGVWFGDTSGTAQLIAREGMAAPGGGGATFGNGFFGVIMNNADMVIFQNSLSDGRNGWFAWGEDFGLIDVAIAGDTSILGANYPLSSIGFVSTSNGDGGVMSFNDNGLFTFIATSSGGPLGNNGAIVVAQIPTPASGVLAGLGLLAGATRRRRR